MMHENLLYLIRAIRSLEAGQPTFRWPIASFQRVGSNSGSIDCFVTSHRFGEETGSVQGGNVFSQCV